MKTRETESCATAVAITTPPILLVTGHRDRDTPRRHHLKAWPDPTEVRRSAATAIAYWLVFPLLILFCASLGNLLDFIYYLQK